MFKKLSKNNKTANPKVCLRCRDDVI